MRRIVNSSPVARVPRGPQQPTPAPRVAERTVKPIRTMPCACGGTMQQVFLNDQLVRVECSECGLTPVDLMQRRRTR